MEILQNIPFKLDIDSLIESLFLEKDSDDAEELNALVAAVRPHLRPKAMYRESFVENRTEETVSIDRVTFSSRVLRTNLDKTERVFPFIATCGTEVDDLNPAGGDFIKQYWIDSIKSKALSASLKYLTGYVKNRYALKKISSMSPGSGDVDIWPIEQQKDLFSLFGNTEKLIGVTLTDSFLMVPNKSVSGILFPTEIDFRTCQVCHRKNCPSRSAPFDEKLSETFDKGNSEIPK